MVNNLVTEIGALSINHVNEELCGDHYEVVTCDNDNTYIAVLADGLGSGVKANILSTLTSKLISTMMANNIPLEECVETIVETLPICKVRGIAYSTFTILKISNNNQAEIYNYDNPEPIMLRDGKEYKLNTTEMIIGGKKIYHIKTNCLLYDTFILLSDGTIHAGIGQSMNFGWERPQIIDYLTSLYSKDYSSKALATELIEHCDLLYDRKPGDDTTCLVARIRKRQMVNLMIGPASNPNDDKEMLSLFFSKEGKHIVCGGTTSNIVAKYLKTPLVVDDDYVDKLIPPISHIKGVDLVTEGVITINKVLDYAKNNLGRNESYFDWCYKQDGASQIAKLLFEEATDINFYVGCAMNPAHQKENLSINYKIKMQLIEELSKVLKTMGKKIKVSYF
jgi:Stage II sporulation protein E (SpoIIE).